MPFKKAKGTDKPLTKAKMIEMLADEVGLAKKDVKALLEAQADLVYAQASVGITLPGLCKVIVRKRKARKGRNPMTGETIKIPAKKVLKCTPVKAAKDAIM